MHKVAIIDYGIGNVLSVSRAVEKCGHKAVLTDNPEEILAADKVILPGVGAFGHAMAELTARKLDSVVKEFVSTGKDLLGICVGMQILFEQGFEKGEHQGLGFIAGSVNPIPNMGTSGKKHTIPHIGWAHLSLTENVKSSIFKDFQDNDEVYFVHSYHGEVSKNADRVAYADYHGIEICAAVQHENIIGLQFHPEKSRDAGLAIINNFITA